MGAQLEASESNRGVQHGAWPPKSTQTLNWAKFADEKLNRGCGQCRFRIRLASRVVQDLSERRQERFDVGQGGGFAHQTDTPDFAFERAETGADFDVEIG